MIIALSIVIPAYNEQLRIGSTLVNYFQAIDKLCQAYPYFTQKNIEVIIVDDGSTDLTVRTAKNANNGSWQLKVVSLGMNSGKGAAVARGIFEASGARILVADADGSAPLEEFIKLNAALEQGAQIAVGSRVLRDKDSVLKAKIIRKFLGSVFRFLVKLLCPVAIKDTQCGFKLFTHAAAIFLFKRVTTYGYAFDVEIIRLAEMAEMKVVEVPISWSHVSGSKVRLIADSLKMLWQLFCLRITQFITYGPQGKKLKEAWLKSVNDRT